MTPSAFLAIDASSDACSAALQVGQASPMIHHSIAPRQHNHLLQTYVTDLLAHIKSTSASLKAVIVGYGPGSFAGVRIATAVAQGVAAVYEVPLVGVSSMKTMAFYFAQQQNLKGIDSKGHYSKELDSKELDSKARLVVVLNDAKMQEAYAGAYRIKGAVVEIEHKDRLVTYAECQRLINHWVETAKHKSIESIHLVSQTPSWARTLLFSSGENENLLDQVPFSIDAASVHASALLNLGIQDFHQGLSVAAEYFEPLYLRQATAWKTLDRQS
jgi:tRNA threonylcarbamoyl adenosine modification protein YeaZ